MQRDGDTFNPKALWETPEPYKPGGTSPLLTAWWGGKEIFFKASPGLVLPEPNKKSVPARKALRPTDNLPQPSERVS